MKMEDYKLKEKKYYKWQILFLPCLPLTFFLVLFFDEKVFFHASGFHQNAYVLVISVRGNMKKKVNFIFVFCCCEEGGGGEKKRISFLNKNNFPRWKL